MFKKCTFHDLTHSLGPDTLTWERDCGFKHTLDADYDQGYRKNSITTPAGIGTHMDAPAHFIEDATTIGEIPLSDLIKPLVLIDVRHKASGTYSISSDDILDFEETHGMIPSNTIVVFNTGWSQYWPDAKAYRNEDSNAIMRYPTVSAAAAQLLLERQIAGLGIDTLSPDAEDSDFPVHKLLLGAGKYLIENLTNLSDLPPLGAWIMTIPIKIKDGTEAPIRAIAVTEKI